MGDLFIPTKEPLLAPETVAYAELCRTALGLQEWKIWLSEHDAPGGDSDTAGYTDLDTRYLRATITLLRGLRPERVREVLLHEMLHVALAWLDQVLRNIVMRLPADDQTCAFALYGEVEDQTIERLVRALRPYLEPAEDSSAEDA
jgi:hypothetical protein